MSDGLFDGSHELGRSHAGRKSHDAEDLARRDTEDAEARGRSREMTAGPGRLLNGQERHVELDIGRGGNVLERIGGDEDPQFAARAEDDLDGKTEGLLEPPGNRPVQVRVLGRGLENDIAAGQDRSHIPEAHGLEGRLEGGHGYLIVTADIDASQESDNGGGRGIRTPVPENRKAVFKTAAFNHSAIPPSIYFFGAAEMRSRPSIKGRKASGMMTEPSAC